MTAQQHISDVESRVMGWTLANPTAEYQGCQVAGVRFPLHYSIFSHCRQTKDVRTHGLCKSGSEHSWMHTWLTRADLHPRMLRCPARKIGTGGCAVKRGIAGDTIRPSVPRHRVTLGPPADGVTEEPDTKDGRRSVWTRVLQNGRNQNSRPGVFPDCLLRTAVAVSLAPSQNAPCPGIGQIAASFFLNCGSVMTTKLSLP